MNKDKNQYTRKIWIGFLILALLTISSGLWLSMEVNNIIPIVVTSLGVAICGQVIYAFI